MKIRSMHRGALALLFAAMAGGMAATPAAAGLFNGNITFVGSGDMQGQLLENATQIDFGNLFSGTGNGMGTPGDFLVLTASGDLAPLFLTSGKIKDLTINPATAPVIGFLVDGGFSFDLSTLSVVSQTPEQLLLGGTGIAFMTGFDPTPGNFTFSADSAASTNFSFSAGLRSVPEPATLGLLGLGLAMLGVAIRRARPARIA